MKKSRNKLILNNFIKKTANCSDNYKKEIKVKKWKHKIITINSNVNSDTFNIVCNGNFSKISTFKNGTNIINRFINLNHQFSWWISEKHLNKQAKQFFAQFNLSIIEKETVMFAKINDINIKATQNRSFRIKKVETDEQYLLFIKLIINAFNPSDMTIIEFYQKLKWHKNPKFYLFLGYFNNNAVCTGSVYFNNKIAGIYDIVTSEKYRNQGFAKLLLNKLFTIIKAKKWKFIALQSTEKAIEFYSKIGFTTLFEIFNYSLTE